MRVARESEAYVPLLPRRQSATATIRAGTRGGGRDTVISHTDSRCTRVSRCIGDATSVLFSVRWSRRLRERERENENE